MNKQPQPNTSQSNVFYVVDGSRKRRQIDSVDSPTQVTTTQRGNSGGYDCSKRPAKAANGDGEILSPGQGRQQITKFREQISYVANAVIKDPPTEISRVSQRFELSGEDVLGDDDAITEEEYVYDPATTSTNPSRDQQSQSQSHPRPPYYVVVNAPERQLLTTVDPSTCTDVPTLQESLNHANNCLIDLIEQQRKLKQQNSILRTRYNVELNRTDDFQRILLERNLRMKQIVSENVRWNVRYTRLKQAFGEEDVNAALGELAPK